MNPRSPRRVDTRVALVSVFAIAIVALAGCAGTTAVTTSAELSSSSETGTTASTASADTTEAPATRPPRTGTTRAAGTTTTARRGTTSTGSSTTSTTATSTSGPPTTLGDPKPEFATWCATFKTGLETIAAMPKATAADKQAFLSVVKQLFSSLHQTAPEPIKADWKILDDAIQARASYDQLEKGDPLAKDASKRITEWTIANCGYNPDKI